MYLNLSGLAPMLPIVYNTETLYLETVKVNFHELFTLTYI